MFASIDKIKFIFSNTQGGISHSNVSIGEISVFDVLGGADLCVGGTPSSSAALGGSKADKAVDNNTGTEWNSPFTSDVTYWQYVFAAPIIPVQYKFQARGAYLNDSPTAWTVQLWNGTELVASFTDSSPATWAALEIRSFSAAFSVPSEAPDEVYDPVWDFIPQTDKYGYQNNPRWTKTPAVAHAHHPCGHWHHPIAEAVPSNLAMGEWKAALEQLGTPYVYLLDTGLYNPVEVDPLPGVVKIDTSHNPPIIVGYLKIPQARSTNKLVRVDVGSASSQKGSYCMNVSQTRLFYMFTQGANPVVLYEIDISGAGLSIIKSATIADVVIDDRQVTDGCSNDEYSFWVVGSIGSRIVKIRNSDFTIVEVVNLGSYSEAAPVSCICMLPTEDKISWAVELTMRDGWWYRTEHTIADLDFNVLDTEIFETEGIYSRESWLDLRRVYGDNIWYTKNYHPSYGAVKSRNFYLEDFCATGYATQYTPQILGVNDTHFWTLHIENSFETDGYIFLNIIQEGASVKADSLLVNEWTGHGAEDYAWYSSNVSVRNSMTGKIVLFTFRRRAGDPDTDYKNYAAVISSALIPQSFTKLDQLTTMIEKTAANTCNPIWPLEEQQNKDLSATSGKGFWKKTT